MQGSRDTLWCLHGSTLMRTNEYGRISLLISTMWTSTETLRQCDQASVNIYKLDFWRLFFFFDYMSLHENMLWYLGTNTIWSNHDVQKIFHCNSYKLFSFLNYELKLVICVLWWSWINVFLPGLGRSMGDGLCDCCANYGSHFLFIWLFYLIIVFTVYTINYFSYNRPIRYCKSIRFQASYKTSGVCVK